MDHYSSPSPSTSSSLSNKESRNLVPQSQHPLAAARQVQSYPQHQPTLTNKELREKVVEILSTTANGCLTELGYFPGMTQRLHDLESTNQSWQAENVKLFEDNRNLLATITDLKTREKLVSVPELEKISRIRNLEQQLASSTNLKDYVHRSQFDDLRQHFQNLRTSYATAYDEVQRLSEHLKHITAVAASHGFQLPPPPPPRKSSGGSNKQADTNHVAAPTHHSAQQPPSAAIQQPAPAGVWQGGQPIRAQGSSSNHTMFNGAVQQRRHVSQPHFANANPHPLQQTRHAQDHHQQQPMHMNLSTSSSSSPISIQSMHQSPHPPVQQIQSPMFAGSMSSSPTASQPGQHSFPPYAQYGPMNGVHDQSTRANNVQSASYPPNPYPTALSMAYQGQPPSRPPSQSAPSPASRRSSASLSLDTNVAPVKVEMPPTSLSTSNPHSSTSASGPSGAPYSYPHQARMPPPIVIPQPPQFGPPEPTFLTPAQVLMMNAQQTQQHTLSPITTMSPNDMYINPPPMPDNQHQLAYDQSYSVPPTPSALAQDQPYQPHQPDSPSAAAAAELTPTPGQLKRNSMTMLEGVPTMDDPQKRPRLEDQQQQMQQVVDAGHSQQGVYQQESYVVDQSQQMYGIQHPNQASYTPVYAPIPSEPVSAPILDQSAMLSGAMYQMQPGMMQVDVNGRPIEEEMEYEVEVGPDGLRLVRDCLEEFFERRDDGGRICRLCVIRQRNNQIPEPPPILVNATDEDLESHCLNVHEKAWMMARQVEA